MSNKDFQMWIYALLFRIVFLESKGQAFEDLFTRIMKCKYGTDFRIIRSYGSAGDMKTDGYQVSEKTVFQCYAPNTIKQAVVLKKIGEDYAGAKAFWKERMVRWRFVHNSTQGLPAEVEQLLRDFNSEADSVRKDTLEFDELKEIVVSLESLHLQSLFGFVPTVETFDDLDVAALLPIVVEISQREIDPALSVSIPSEEKMSVNRLSTETKGLLLIGSLRMPLVQKLIEEEIDPVLGERIAQSFRERYAKAKEKYVNSDDIFADLQQFAGGMKGAVKRQCAVLAVLSYFFETCDIFEDVSSLREVKK